MKIRPLRGYVLLALCKEDAITKGGIIIPESARSRSLEAMVLATGPGSWNEAGTRRKEPGVKVGDRVIISRYAGTELKKKDLKDVETLMVLEDEIQAVLEN